MRLLAGKHSLRLERGTTFVAREAIFQTRRGRRWRARQQDRTAIAMISFTLGRCPGCHAQSYTGGRQFAFGQTLLSVDPTLETP